MRGLTATRAYQQSARHRSVREQEADVFRRVNAALRTAQEGDALARVRALADNDRLWITLMDLMRDSANALPPAFRAAVISVGMAVQREAGTLRPDLGFLIGVNEQFASGLSGAQPQES